MGLNSPFTVWEGDDVHVRRPVLTSVAISLDKLFARPAGASKHVIATGEVRGRLHGQFPSIEATGVSDLASRLAGQDRDATVTARDADDAEWTVAIGAAAAPRP